MSNFCGRCGQPVSPTDSFCSDAQAVTLTIAAVGPTEAGHVDVYPYNTTPPAVGTVFDSTDQVTRTNATIQLSETGTICVINNKVTGLTIQATADEGGN